jgi:hypothetical protein
MDFYDEVSLFYMFRQTNYMGTSKEKPDATLATAPIMGINLGVLSG